MKRLAGAGVAPTFILSPRFHESPANFGFLISGKADGRVRLALIWHCLLFRAAGLRRDGPTTGSQAELFSESGRGPARRRL